MGYNDPDDKKPSWVAEFIENVICGFLAFTYCIGGWLAHFGMDFWWMLALSAVAAIVFGWFL